MEERKRILNMVKEGKLTVDEALNLLELLESGLQKQEGELSTTVHFEEAKKEDTVHQKVHSAKDKLFDFVDTAFKKIKDFDLDLNFGQSIEVSHIFHHTDVFLKDMDIDVANGSVKIVPWDQKDVRIECQAKVYRVENQDKARQNFLKDVHFTIEGGKMRFHIQQKWMKVDAVIFVPQIDYDRVRARIFNGPISGEKLHATDLKVKAANGKMNLAELVGKKMEAETVNGHINIINSQFDEIEAETINGPIQLGGDFQKVEMQSFNGDLSASLSGNRCENLLAKATTGSIDVYIPEGIAVSGELKTNFGSFNVLLDGIQITEEKNEMIQKLLRFKSDHPSLILSADTKTGSVTVHKLDGAK
ncbi:MAG TPA: DUF4097 domain-containing protein [Bacillales bacterium]|nr:DUF4097 domain-containing protein [Bacillales bacterium]